MGTVKHFLHTDANAPVMSGTPGALIGVLDACLVNGFNLQQAVSLTVANGVASVEVPNGAAYRQHQVIEVSGATPASLNGQHIVQSRVGNVITYNTAAPDGTATGTITVKLAPAGWEKVFSGTNVAVYRSPNMLGTRMWLRVTDTGTTIATIDAFEHMFDEATGEYQWGGAFYWAKSITAGSTPRIWWLVADDRTFYLRIDSGGPANNVYFFGDIKSLRPADPYACVACIGTGGADISTGSSVSYYGVYSAHTGAVSDNYASRMRIARYSDYITRGQDAYRHFNFPGATSGNLNVSGEAYYHPIPFPNPANNGLVYDRVRVHERNNHTLRGHMRGMFVTTQHCYNAFSGLYNAFQGGGDHQGKTIGVFQCQGGVALSGGYAYQQTNSYNQNGRVLFDLTGPW